MRNNTSHILDHALSASNIGQGLIQAYLDTEYRVYLPDNQTIILSIGMENVPLKRLHQQYAVSCSAFLTAWNPFSHETDDSTNNQRQSQLTEAANLAGFDILPAVGIHKNQDQGGEESLLSLGMSLADAIECGQTWEQNAIVWIGSDTIPKLVLLK